MDIDPLPSFTDWTNKLRATCPNHGKSRHHCIPSSRSNQIILVKNFFPKRPSGQSWNIMRIEIVPHMLWHVMFNRHTPWEAIRIIKTGTVFKEWDSWRAFGWLMVFGDFSSRQAAGIITEANGNLPQVCLARVPAKKAVDRIITHWTTPVVRDYLKLSKSLPI